MIFIQRPIQLEAVLRRFTILFTILLSLTRICFHPAHISTPKGAYNALQAQSVTHTYPQRPVIYISTRRAYSFILDFQGSFTKHTHILIMTLNYYETISLKANLSDLWDVTFIVFAARFIFRIIFLYIKYKSMR